MRDVSAVIIQSFYCFEVPLISSGFLSFLSSSELSPAYLVGFACEFYLLNKCPNAIYISFLNEGVTMSAVWGLD